MKLSDHQKLFAHDVAVLIKQIFKDGYSCTLGEVYRTQEQAEIYAKQGKGIKNSLHCSRLAIDINLFSPDGTYLTDSKDYLKCGSFWESLDKNNEWGGFFAKRYGSKRVDGNHFQRNL